MELRPATGDDDANIVEDRSDGRVGFVNRDLHCADALECSQNGFCDGTATVASAAVDACEADLAGAGCAAGMPASCDDILPVPDGTIDVSWGFYASMGCDDFYGTDTIRVVATNSGVSAVTSR